MTDKKEPRKGGDRPLSGVLESVKAELLARGIDLEACCGPEGDEPGKVKIVCIAPNLEASVAELGQSPRDQVVMVRVDEETSKRLDAWVESGAVKSRSEAAALFIREGLKVRSSELASLEEALKDVDRARAKLREKARRVLGPTKGSEND